MYIIIYQGDTQFTRSQVKNTRSPGDSTKKYYNPEGCSNYNLFYWEYENILVTYYYLLFKTILGIIITMILLWCY